MNSYWLGSPETGPARATGAGPATGVAVAFTKPKAARIADGVEVRVPGSTANLGAGFDCFGLALDLHLCVRARVSPEPYARTHICYRGQGAAWLRRQGIPEGLILRGMQFTAEREGFVLPSVRLVVRNAIPPGAGLGGSAAAIVAGVSLCAALAKRDLSCEKVLAYASELEGHADNAAAAIYGGLNVTCTREGGKVVALQHVWPDEIRIVAVTPHLRLPTRRARAVLPEVVAHREAVHNVQRATLLCCALAAGRYDLLWEATQDRLHQPFRRELIPGLAEALATPRMRGLVGLTLSGAGPTVAGLATDNFQEIGEAIAAPFRRRGIGATVRCLRADVHGRCVTLGAPRANAAQIGTD